MIARALSFAAAAWLALAALPASAGLFDDDVARKQIADLSRRFEAANARQEELAGRVARMDETVRAANQPVLELANQLQVLREEMRQLRGQIEVLSNTVEGNAKRQRDMYVDLDARLRRFEGAGQPGAPGSVPGAVPRPGAAAPGEPMAGGGAGAVATIAPTAGASTAVAAGPADEKSAYEAAQNLRRNGSYLAAIGAFQQFIQQHPRSALASRAQYWIGDSYYNLRDYKSAVASQQRLIASYPDSASVPDALLNIASAQVELGELRAARTTMSSLVSRYPSSDAAEKAKRRLSTLR